jgi:hypothetical protein
MDLGGIDRDILLLFFRERVEDKRVFEGPTLCGATRAKRVEFSVGQRPGRIEDSTNHGGLAVIDMAHKHNLERTASFRFPVSGFRSHMNPFARSFCIACGS